jgi:hypothetical protein
MTAPEEPMNEPDTAPRGIDCPSAQPTDENAMIYGVVTGAPEARRIAYLTKAQPATPALLALAGDAKPGQVFRTVAPCVKDGCRHFAGGSCTLAQRIVQSLDPVVNGLPPCQIRKTCRWFQQEGKAACLRCPQVVTEHGSISPLDSWIDGTA